VRLAQPARRIVSLAPHITELLFAVGAGGRVVGVDAWSDYPAPARALARVGDLYALDLERIVALKPDLVVVWRNGNSQRQLDVLRALGLPIYYDEPRRLADIPRSLERLGRLAGQADGGQAAASALKVGLDHLRAHHAGSAPVSVFYQVWSEPLLTVNNNTLIGDVINLCGGRNIFGQLPMQAPRVGVEAVIEADPQVILAAALGPTAEEGSGAGGASDPAFAPWRRWPRLRAVRGGHLVALPDDLISRHSPRVLQGAERLCAALQAARSPS
jgi:iron complex transport system substrate-binding protein